MHLRKWHDILGEESHVETCVSLVQDVGSCCRLLDARDDVAVVMEAIMKLKEINDTLVATEEGRFISITTTNAGDETSEICIGIGFLNTEPSPS